jgi:hypothetical protein
MMIKINKEKKLLNSILINIKICMKWLKMIIIIVFFLENYLVMMNNKLFNISMNINKKNKIDLLFINFFI